jgi:hypothetical protein
MTHRSRAPPVVLLVLLTGVDAGCGSTHYSGACREDGGNDPDCCVGWFNSGSCASGYNFNEGNNPFFGCTETCCIPQSCNAAGQVANALTTGTCGSSLSSGSSCTQLNYPGGDACFASSCHAGSLSYGSIASAAACPEPCTYAVHSANAVCNGNEDGRNADLDGDFYGCAAYQLSHGHRYMTWFENRCYGSPTCDVVLEWQGRSDGLYDLSGGTSHDLYSAQCSCRSTHVTNQACENNDQGRNADYDGMHFHRHPSTPPPTPMSITNCQRTHHHRQIEVVVRT